MKIPSAALFVAAATLPLFASASEMTRPEAGKPPIMKTSEIKPGMKGVAWTVFQGFEPEPVPVEIIGVWKNMWGPGQDIILGKMGGKVQRTNVAGGMSGSPVYIDGKLIGAVSTRIGAFSPDAICGITPVELMLEVQDFDTSQPADAIVPDRVQARSPYRIPGDLLNQAVAAGASPKILESPYLTPIETPLAFSGFHESVLREFGPFFQQLGIKAVQGGASSTLRSPKPAPGWEKSLRPGDAISAVLVSGDMSISALGTVTYNDGKKVLAFGHPLFNIGPVNMPIAKAEVLMVFASSFSPNKFGNATEIVGALRQDRHSAILGELGATSEMIPVEVRVRSFNDAGAVRKEKKLSFNVFVQQKWTPYLMMVTLFNCISGLNDFAEEATYRLMGQVELDGEEPLSLSTMQAPSDLPIPAPMQLAGWWGDKFNRLFLNAAKFPKFKSVNATIDLLPERRVASIENAWVAESEVDAGSEIPVKVFLRPFRGERIEREFKVKIPTGLPKGTHRILLSDADTLNRMQARGASNRYMDLQQTVSLINQERSNNKLYVSILQSRPTVYYDDKTLPSLPASVLNVLQTGRTASRGFTASAETAHEQLEIPFDQIISGSFSLNITVR